MELRLDRAAPLLIIAAALSGVATGTTERDIANGAAGASVKCGPHGVPRGLRSDAAFLCAGGGGGGGDGGCGAGAACGV